MAGQRNGYEQPEPQPFGETHRTDRRQKAIGQHQRNRQHDKTDDRVRVPAVVQQIPDGRRRDRRVCEIDVWKVGRDEAGADHERPRFRGAAPHRRIRERDAHQRVRDVVHYRWCARKRSRT